MRLVSWLLLLFLLGCAAPQRLLPPQDLQRIYGKIIRTEVSGYASFILEGRGRKIAGQAFVSASSDGSFTIDVVDPFIRPLYSISYSGGWFTFLSIRENRSYKKKIHPYGRVSFEGIPVMPIALSSAILGYPPFMVKDGMVEERKGLYHLILKDSGLSLRMILDPQGWIPLRLRIYDREGDLIYSQRNTFEGGRLKGVEVRGVGYRLRVLFTEWGTPSS